MLFCLVSVSSTGVSCRSVGGQRRWQWPSWQSAKYEMQLVSDLQLTSVDDIQLRDKTSNSWRNFLVTKHKCGAIFWCWRHIKQIAWYSDDDDDDHSPNETISHISILDDPNHAIWYRSVPYQTKPNSFVNVGIIRYRNFGNIPQMRQFHTF